MRRLNGMLCALMMLGAVAALGAEFVQVFVRDVPVERLTANLERQLAADPKNIELIVNLARIHAMAFALKRDAVPASTRVGRPEPIAPWLGQGAPAYEQFPVRATDDPRARAAAAAHLEKAIARYREALSIAPDHLVAKLGLGWSLVQAGDREAATVTLRDVVARAWPVDEKGVHVHMGHRSLTEEAAHYLLPLLDPDRNREERAILRERVARLEKRGRFITPIAIPLGDGLTALDIADDNASVLFDADGSGILKRWTWIRANAAWLVFDRQGSGRIDSALQLFGSVSFWLFWQNGYHALRALDDNADGQISGGELDGLALWHDRNGDGISDRGEVRSVALWGIVSLSTAYRYDATHPDEIAVSTRGVTLRNGTTRPTFDLILRTTPGR